MKSSAITEGMSPHPKSRASLLALNASLRQESLSRARALADLAAQARIRAALAAA